MDMATISVITPTWNSAETIEHCLQSVANQSYPSKEHLIIDNDSTDETMAIVRSYADTYSHIRILSEKDSGIYDAMNKSLPLCRGDWVYFLGSDDTLYDTSVFKDIAIELEEGIDIIYGDVILDGLGKRYGGLFSSNRLRWMNICQQAVFYRKSLFDIVGAFDTKYRISADWDFHIRCFNRMDVHIQHVDRIIAKYALTGYSTGKTDYRFMLDRAIKNVPLNRLGTTKGLSCATKKKIENGNL